MIHEVTKRFRLEMAHRLPGHGGKCRHLHGHSYVVEFTLGAEAVSPETAILYDFGAIKANLASLIGAWDHSTVLYAGDPLVGAVRAHVDHDRVHTTIEPPSAEHLAALFFEEARLALVVSLSREGDYTPYLVAVSVHETADSWAVYRPRKPVRLT